MSSFLKIYFLPLILTVGFSFVYSHNSSDNRGESASALDEVKIALQIDPRNRLDLDLKQVHRVLANENLRVWGIGGDSSDGENPGNNNDQLRLKNKVMKRLGPFTFYQDPNMNAAAVYYHGRQKFDGIIDTRYIIRGLPLDHIHGGAKTVIRLGESGIITRPESLDHPPNEVATTNQDEVNEDESRIIPTYQNKKYDAYPEILVIVSAEMVAKLRQTPVSSDKYVTVVSYVLTLFNAVDMLYSKLEDTNIKLNLAGILIASESESSTFLKECYSQPLSASQYYATMVKDTCAIEGIKHFILKDRESIPLDSYDMIFFLTANHPFGVLDDRVYVLEGSSQYLPVYSYKKLNYAPTLIAMAREDGTFRNYATIAHELAHLMNVKHDDGHAIQDGECCGHIMKLDSSYWCKICSTWSSKSENAFSRFFSSADACGFTNYPRSLLPKGRREMLTANHQCQCYGYKSAATSDVTDVGYCGDFLKCLDENDEVHETLRPLDGTSCGNQKVCWQNICKSTRECKPRP